MISEKLKIERVSSRSSRPAQLSNTIYKVPVQYEEPWFKKKKPVNKDLVFRFIENQRNNNYEDFMRSNLDPMMSRSTYNYIFNNIH